MISSAASSFGAEGAGARRVVAPAPTRQVDTVVCVAPGPSLTAADTARIPPQCLILAVNGAYHRALHADVLYAPDAKWWMWHRDVPDGLLPPHKITLDPAACQWRRDLDVYRWTGKDGLDLSPGCVRTGGHGGYQLINVAAHYRPRTIILLGYDLMPGPRGEDHCHAPHPDGNHPRYAERRGVYHTLVAPLAAAGITVYNASRRTAITAFPCCPLDHALAA